MSKGAIILKRDAGGRVLVPVERQVELVREFERSGLSGPKFAEIAGVEYQIGRVGSRRGDQRRRGVAGGFHRKPGASFSSTVPFPAPARRTGRAAFPHPALISDFLAFAFDRSARLPASSMRPSFS